MGSNLHLVNDEGQPLPKRIADQVDRLHAVITQRFAHLCDPAELSNAMEHEAKKLARFDGETHLSGLSWRVLFNGAISVVRKRKRLREESLSPESFRNLTGTSDNDPETRLIRIEEERALLLGLSAREQEYLNLRDQGFDDEEVAAHLKLSKNALAQFKHRLKVKLAENGYLKS